MATGSGRARGGDAQASLQQSVDHLADAFDRMATRLETLEGGGGYAEGDKVQRHIRRYMPFYALATVWALMLLILPTRPDGAGTAEQAGALTPTEQGFVDSGGSAVSAGSAGNASSATGSIAVGGGSGGASVKGPGGATTVPGATAVDPLAWTAKGKTRGGFDCAKGIRQIPWSRYAPPCFPAFTGSNGGATSRGVTEKEIVIVHRDFPDTAASQATAAYVQAAGFASPDEFKDTRLKFAAHFNKIFELWGRKVKYIYWTSQYGNSTDEALSKGKEGACADADAIIAEFKPFMVVGDTTGVFGECAGERKLMADGAGAYYPDTWYRKYHPYLWAGVMECERIAHMNAEYIGKKLANKPAKWSKDRLLDKSKRVIGLIVPDNDQYSFCVDIAERVGKEKYGSEIASRYNYQLDIQRFPDEAAKAIVQFNAAQCTTIFLATDPLIPIFLTQSARGQEYFPEWIINSAGLTDVEQFARLWDQESIQWSLWGMSQLGDTGRILGPKGEGTQSYKKFFGTNIPPGTQTEYYALLRVFGLLQAAGPVLTPQNIAAAAPRLPAGGAPEYEVGHTSFATNSEGGPGFDHTSVDDMREVYWLCSQIGGDSGGRCSAPKSYDGNGGTYVVLNGGKRFLPGQWVAGDSPGLFKEKP
ncbi:MAG: hypothetical protein WD826_04110 [Actinomycetota bacterium]